MKIKFRNQLKKKINELTCTLLKNRKQTKRVLTKIYYSPQSKISISLEVGVETKLFSDSAFGNSLCNSWYKTKLENPLFFSWPPMPLEIKLLHPMGSQVCPGTLKRFRTNPSQWNGPLFLRQTQLLYFCK
jgi:hypothetical protein